MSNLISHDTLYYLSDYPYHQLASILGETSIEKDKHVLLHVGEPKTPQPEKVKSIIDAHSSLWSRYPPVNGSQELRHIIALWINKRYALQKLNIEGQKNVLCSTGSKEAIIQAVMAAKLIKESKLKTNQKPLIILPSPAYHVYFGAALAQNLDIMTLSVTHRDEFIADLTAVKPEDWQRCVGMVLCTPNNPTGIVFPKDDLKKCLELAQMYDFKLISDECYSEIYVDTPPCGVLEVADEDPQAIDSIIVVNSLSKRSGVPGLRSGFIVTGEKTLQILSLIRGYVGTQLPGPNDRVAQYLWQDEEHVEIARQFYREALNVFNTVFQGMDTFTRSEASFFNWFNCKMDGKKFTQFLWKNYGVSVLPGVLMTNHFDKKGKKANNNYIRLAAIYEPAKMMHAAKAIKDVFEEHH